MNFLFGYLFGAGTIASAWWFCVTRPSEFLNEQEQRRRFREEMEMRLREGETRIRERRESRLRVLEGGRRNG